MPSSRPESRPGSAAVPVLAVLLLVSLPLLFRQPATTIRRAELFTELVSRLAESSEAPPGSSLPDLDSLLAQVAPDLGPLPAVGGDLVAGMGSIYPTVFVYVYDPASASMLIASSRTGRLSERERTTVSGSYGFTSTGDGVVTLFLLTGSGDGGWPGLAYDRLSACF